MLALAGQNFLILYAVAAASLIKLSTKLSERVLGLCVLAIAGMLLTLQGPLLVYPIALIVVAISMSLTGFTRKQIEKRRKSV
jgi:amino acid efflux transporter